MWRTETVPPRPHLVEHTVHLVERLPAVVHTGAGVEGIKAAAAESPERATLTLVALRGGALCNRHPTGAGSLGRLVVLSPG